MPKISIIVPVKNEEKNIEKLVARIHSCVSEANIPYEIIFIDDHSTDRTMEVSNSLNKKYPIRIFTKQGKLGKGFSILEGVTHAQSDIICMIDADLQYDPKHIPDMYKKIIGNDEMGVVIAERKTYKGALLRRFASRFNAFILGRLLFNLPYDIQSGLKVFRKSIAEHIDVRHVGSWSFDIPLLFTAQQLGHTIDSLQITFEHRENGESKIKMGSVAAELLQKALHLRVSHNKLFQLKPTSQDSMVGAGIIHKKHRYITHTNLPHHKSAIRVLHTGQKIILATCLILFVSGVLINPINTLIVVMSILTSIYFIDVLFNFHMVLKSLQYENEIKATKAELEEIQEDQLPVYSILCPLYKEAHMIPQFVKGISQIDWPQKKLDVMLLLEEDDVKTIAAARKISLPPFVRIVIVPDSEPKTKPKATNYGLAHAKGEYVVIFDAEDIPDPLQLKKAYIAFNKVDKNVVCLQAKLNYYNPHHNLLTRLFTAEYSLWFDIILPGLQSLSTSIPLGGTSNHFRKSELEKVHGWDPFNVTEDCDLGTRLFKLGYRTAIIDSVTLEEANSNVLNWIRQRSRWIKGYIQTYFVHMREPISFFSEHGIHALLFNVVVGGKIAFLFINPILWITTISYFLLYSYVGAQIEAIFPTIVFYMAAISLIFGNFLYLFYYMVGSAKRNHWSLIKYIYLVPLYWLLVSTAALVAVYQLIFKPHYWEKTVHGFHLDKGADDTKSDIPQSKHTESNNIKKSRTGEIMLVAGAIFGYGCNFLTNIYLSNTLTNEDFSLVSLMGSFFFLSAIILAPLSNTIAHQVAYINGKHKTITLDLWTFLRKNGFVISLLIALLWVINLQNLASFFKSSTLLPFIFMTPVWILGTFIALDRGFALGLHLFTLTSIVVSIEALIKMIVSYLAIKYQYQFLVFAAMPISLFISLVVLNIGNLGFIKNTKALLSTNTKFPRKFFATSFITGTATLAFLSIDLILAKHFLSIDDAGKYAILSLIGKIIFFIGTIFSQLINPIVSKKSGENSNTKHVFHIIFGAIFIASFSCYILLGPLSFFSLPLLLGSKSMDIIPYTSEYGLALLLLTLATAFVTYHQSRKEYLHTIISMLIIPAQIIGIYFYHGSLDVFIHVIFTICALYFFLSLIMHLFYNFFYSLTNNMSDFFGLFTAKGFPTANKSESVYRILIFNWRDIKHTWAGGAEVYVHNMAKELVKKGHTVTIFAGSDGKHPHSETIDNIQIIRRGGFYTVYIWAFLYYIFMLRGNYDIIIDSQNGVPFFTPLYSGIPKILLIHHVHQDVFNEHLRWPFNKIASFIEGALMPRVYRNTTLITVSSSSKKAMIKLGIGNDESIKIINPGIYLKNFSKRVKTRHPSFIYLGRLKAYKNIGIVINAFGKILQKYPNAQLTITGMGEDLSNLNKLVGELNISHSVCFTGKVSEEEKIKLLGESWAVLQPSMIEGFGITIIEANAAGTPSIASRTTGLTDSVVDRKTGILCTPKNVQSFYNAMIEIIEDASLRKSLSENAYAWSKEFSWETTSASLSSLISEKVRSYEPNKGYLSINVTKA